MIIKNNTGNILEIGFYDRFNVNMKQRLCLRPHGKCEILPKDGIILNPIELKAHMDNGSISIEGRTPVTLKISETPEQEEQMVEQDVTETPVITSDVEDTLVESPAEVEAVVETTEETAKEENDESSFVCEVCGKEFASSRGLNKHMKSHES